MKLVYDPVKRESNIKKHKLDFEDCAEVFAGPTFNTPDTRKDYGELRIRTFGLLGKRLVSVVWTQRKGARRIISMRKANAREKRDFEEQLR